MTSTTRLRRVVAPLVSAITTTVLLSGVLWIQHVRGGWPFAPREQPVAPAAMAQDMAGMTAGAMPDRVPVDATVSMQHALGVRIEQVGRESLTQTIQAVATVVPDESRISHVHTRVAGWVEQLDVNTTGELVRAGQPLARIFSQELLASQTEYLAARRATSASGIASAVIASGRTRLTVLGMSQEEITEIVALLLVRLQIGHLLSCHQPSLLLRHSQRHPKAPQQQPLMPLRPKRAHRLRAIAPGQGGKVGVMVEEHGVSVRRETSLPAPRRPRPR
jgi:hypothetical protein